MLTDACKATLHDSGRQWQRECPHCQRAPAYRHVLLESSRGSVVPGYALLHGGCLCAQHCFEVLGALPCIGGLLDVLHGITT